MAHRLTAHRARSARATGLEPEIALRPAVAADRDILRTIYATTRADELAPVPWTDEEKTAFVTMQFDAQDRWYRQAYPEGEFLLVLRGGRPIGRLYLARLKDEVRLIDIALLPEERGRGIGSRLVRDVLRQADAARLAVRLHVEPWNPALRLYERLGFRVLEEGGIYLFMECRNPATTAGVASADAPPARQAIS